MIMLILQGKHFEVFTSHVTQIPCWSMLDVSH